MRFTTFLNRNYKRDFNPFLGSKMGNVVNENFRIFNAVLQAFTTYVDSETF